MAKLKTPGIMDVLFTPNITQPEMYFQALGAPPLMMMLSQDDIYQLYKIATSLKYNAKMDEKYKLIDQIMRKRGFRKFASGTNRVIYACEENANILLKVALDRVGIFDNPAEYRNQWLLQPYVCKCFEVSSCGTVGVFERLIPITHIQEFANIANDVFDVIVFKLLGKFVLDDIGSEYFMNWAIRRGFGPCLIDYPYVYKLDSNRLYCNREIEFGSKVYCGGEIDYDDGFNNIVCKKCGKRYLAKELEDKTIANQIVLKGGSKMKVGYIDENGNVKVVGMSSDCIAPSTPKAKSKKHSSLKVVGAMIDVNAVPEEHRDPFNDLFRAVDDHLGENKLKVISSDEQSHMPTQQEFIKAVAEMYDVAVQSGLIPEDVAKDIAKQEAEESSISEEKKNDEVEKSIVKTDVEKEISESVSSDSIIEIEDDSSTHVADIEVGSKLIRNNNSKRDQKGRFISSKSIDEFEDEDDDSPRKRREEDKKKRSRNRKVKNIENF